VALSLDAALSGLLQQQRNIELIANNLGNVNTTGYKRVEVHFEDVLDTVQLLEVLRGERIVGDATVPAGVQSDAVDRVFAQGPMQPTGRALDWAIVGDGMFRVRLEDGTPAFTRAGNFLLDGNGDIVTSDGLFLDPPLTLPDGWRDLELARDGTVSVLRPMTQAEIAAAAPDSPTDGVREVVGQLQLSTFPDAQQLASIGASLYVETVASGAAVSGAPTANGTGEVVAGVLEGSNVDLATEMSALVIASRAYQLNLQAYRSVEEMLSAANTMPAA
jgi:flagellar basal-body rod protein FlgG